MHALAGVSASAEARVDANRADPDVAMPSAAVNSAASRSGVPQLAAASDASLGAHRERHIPQVNWALGGLAPAADDEVPRVGDDIGVGGSHRIWREPVVLSGVRRGGAEPEGDGDQEAVAAAANRGTAGDDVDVARSRTNRTEPVALSGVRRGGAGREGNWDEEVLAPTADCGAAGDDVGVVRSPGWLTEPAARRGWRDRLVPERFRGIRVDPGRRGVCTLLAVGVVAMVVAGVVIFRERPVARPVPPLPAVHSTADAAAPALPSGTETQSAARPKLVESAPAAGELVVSVVGLVHRTGLVRLPTGARVADALTAAGGPRDGADTTGLNLAQRLSDGDQVLVGPSGADPAAPKLGSATISAGGRPTAPSAPGSAQPTPSSGRLDLNTATEAQLDALPGVGPVTAKAIIAWRTTHGRFTDITQLGEVDGIGPARLARLRELVRV
ncbi:helix-hairpin-helix domain-containing protein [Nocardia brasiliensis]|uniref:helix-hairpin-helix domain-containing protein n=1 Tax=Nocardia brasiliensis TaxID=37326 RepID=UPI003D9401C4